MPEIKLYELGPTRSSRCRWALLEAGLDYESVGNEPSILLSDELKKIHPLGKLPAATIDGRPLFESAALTAAIADLVPEKKLIPPPGSWERNLHDQWVFFALTEMEAWVSCAELNTLEFSLPNNKGEPVYLGLRRDQHVPTIVEQCKHFYRRGAKVLDAHLAKNDFLVDGRFTVADVVVGYTVNFGDEFGWLEGFPSLLAYQERLFEREHCTLARHDHPD